MLIAQEVLDASGHSEVIDPAIPPSCTESGLTEGSHCSVCNETLIPQQTIPMTDHQIDTWNELKAPSCTEQGLKWGECTVCHKRCNQVVDALGHLPTQLQVIPASGGSDGSIGAVLCSRCGITLTEQAVIHRSRVIWLPAMITEIEAEAFFAVNAEQISLGNQVNTIGSRAFANCVALKLVVVPASVTFIADDAFDGADQVILLVPQDSYAHRYALMHGLRCVIAN